MATGLARQGRSELCFLSPRTAYCLPLSISHFDGCAGIAWMGLDTAGRFVRSFSSLKSQPLAAATLDGLLIARRTASMPGLLGCLLSSAAGKDRRHPACALAGGCCLPSSQTIQQLLCLFSSLTTVNKLDKCVVPCGHLSVGNKDGSEEET